METSLIVALMEPESAPHVAKLFAEFDKTGMPHRMGTRRRQLFYYRGLYFHLQDFAEGVSDGDAAIEQAKTLPQFKAISADLRPYIDPYDPNWKTPKDAMATRFYGWEVGG